MDKIPFLRKEEKYETKLNVVQFNAKYYENFMNFKEVFSDFQSFMNKYINIMKVEGEQDLLNYLSNLDVKL